MTIIFRLDSISDHILRIGKILLPKTLDMKMLSIYTLILEWVLPLDFWGYICTYICRYGIEAKPMYDLWVFFGSVNTWSEKMKGNNFCTAKCYPFLKCVGCSFLLFYVDKLVF